MRVKKAEYVKDYKIKLQFSDGITKIIDFKPFLNSAKKIIAPLLDMEYFNKFFVDEITICWPNGLDFAPDMLYNVGQDVKKRSIATTKRKPPSVSKRSKKSIKT